MGNNCENLTLFIVNELSGLKKQEFEQHLNTCGSCQQEILSLQDTWQTLSLDFEEVDVPDTLKADVMNFVFEEEKEVKINEGESIYSKPKTEAMPIKQNRTARLRSFFIHHFSPLTAVVMGVLLISCVGLIWNNFQLKENIAAISSKENDPSKIITTLSLKGKDMMQSANGTAYLLQSGRETNLVVQVSNMPDTKDEEVYHVWLLKNGERQSAGTLKPDSFGNGLLSFHLPENQTFDEIGITLEPNPYSTEPLGKKVMGTF